MLDDFPTYLDKYPRHISSLMDGEDVMVSSIAKNLINNLLKYSSNEITINEFKNNTLFEINTSDRQEIKSLYYMRNRLIELLSSHGDINGPT